MTNSTEIKNQTATKTCQGKCPDTICWNCRYATGKNLPKPLTLTSKKTGKKRTFCGCPWATSGIRVPGWNAEKTIIKNPETFGGKQDSYVVYECPHFEEDDHKEVEIEEVIEALSLPVRYSLSNRTILWDYYEIYKMILKEFKKNRVEELTSDEILSIKKAAINAYGEDIEYELDNDEITLDEYEEKIDAVETLKENLIKYHNKSKKKDAPRK